MGASKGRGPAISVIVPILNERENLVAGLSQYAPWRAAGDELLVVDGGSSDGSVALAARWCDRVIHAPRGRAAQMNAGARLARGRLLWFMHIDTHAPFDLRDALVGQTGWGRFDVRFDAAGRAFRIIESLMNWRSRLSGIATGDQGLFVSAELFTQAGGYPPLALMEDIELSARLRALERPTCLRNRVVTSARRWRRHGIARTVVLMWCLRLAWWLGVSDRRLARWYGC